MHETELLRSLRSVRRFAETAVPDDVLADVLEVARWTGSAKNRQPWELVVVAERETLERLSGLGLFAGHVAKAPVAIVLLMDGSSGSGNILFDEGRLAERIMLAAWAHGVGGCMATLFPEKNVRAAGELLGLPEGLTARTVISLGYPADENARFLRSTPLLLAVAPVGRKPLEDLVSWEQYGRRESLRSSRAERGD